MIKANNLTVSEVVLEKITFIIHSLRVLNELTDAPPQLIEERRELIGKLEQTLETENAATTNINGEPLPKGHKILQQLIQFYLNINGHTFLKEQYDYLLKGIDNLRDHIDDQLIPYCSSNEPGKEEDYAVMLAKNDGKGIGTIEASQFLQETITFLTSNTLFCNSIPEKYRTIALNLISTRLWVCEMAWVHLNRITIIIPFLEKINKAVLKLSQTPTIPN